MKGWGRGWGISGRDPDPSLSPAAPDNLSALVLQQLWPWLSRFCSLYLQTSSPSSSDGWPLLLISVSVPLSPPQRGVQ